MQIMHMFWWAKHTFFSLSLICGHKKISKWNQTLPGYSMASEPDSTSFKVSRRKQQCLPVGSGCVLPSHWWDTNATNIPQHQIVPLKASIHFATSLLPSKLSDISCKSRQEPFFPMCKLHHLHKLQALAMGRSLAHLDSSEDCKDKAIRCNTVISAMQ